MTFTDVAEEIERLRSAKERVLKALQLSPGGLTNHYLRQSHIGGARAMGRVNELIHEDGYAIDVVREHGSTWRVTLRASRSATPLLQPPLLPRRTRPRRTAQARLF